MICLKNDNCAIEYDEASGMISSLTDFHREYVKEEISVFEMALRDGCGKQRRLTAAKTNLKFCESDEDGFVCTYEGDDVTVTVRMKLTDEIAWEISVTPSETYVLEWVQYPQIAVPNDLKGQKGGSQILWGFNEGVIVDDLDLRERKCGYREPEYPGEGIMGIYPAIVETQFMAYCREETGGLYVAAHDVDDHLKGIDFCGYKSGISLLFRHYPGGNFGEPYRMPYPMVMKFFAGSWYSAAGIYRDWFEKERADFLIPIAQNSKLPAWYGESPVVVTYPVRGRHDTDEMFPNKLFPYCNALPHIRHLEEELGSRILVLLMHWEGTAPWAPPYVWPPYGGEEALKAFIDALHERGDLLGVYCSGLGWTQQSNLVKEYNREKQFEEQGLKEVMCLSPEQELPYSKICTGQRTGYDMCPSQAFPVRVLKHEVDKMAAAGIDYIQLMDQNHGGTSYFCYSKKHGHSPVPGKWQVDAVRKLLAEVEKDEENVLFGCESAAAESYISYLQFSDNRYNLNYNIGMPVPVYAFLYHPYINNFMGNQVCTQAFFDYKKSPESLCERIAYAFMAGDMMTVVLDENGAINWNWGKTECDELPDQESVKKLIRNLNMWRQEAGKKYLHTGRMVEPYPVICGENIFYAPDGKEKYFPRIYTSAWETGEDERGQFLINYNRERVECTVDLPKGRHVFSVDGEHEEIMAEGRQTIEVPALSAVLMETL